MTALETVLRDRHLPGLDGLRAVAVGLVVLYHGGFDVPGDLGVTTFFVLSGFLITWLLIQEEATQGSISIRYFLARRSLRIFPAYFAFVGASIVVDTLRGFDWELHEILSALTYTVNYDNALTGHDHPVAHAWSLAIEEQFYLIWPLLFVFLASHRRRATCLGALVALALAWRSLLYLGFGWPEDYVYNAFETRFDSIGIGCLFALACTSRRFLELAPRLAQRVWYPLPTLVLLYVSRTQIGSDWHYSIGFSADSMLIALFLVQMLQLSQSALWSWLNTGVAVWLGTLSYSLYLWHQVGLGFADNLTGGESHAVDFALGVVLSVLLAALSYYCVERYFLRQKSRFAVASHPTLTAQQSLAGSGP